MNIMNYYDNNRRRRGLLTWKSVALLVVLMVVSSEAQTFQYSRGWTNGKRNGGMSVSPYEAVESGLVGVGVDPMDMIIPPGHLQMNLVPQGRFRSLDYNQVKRYNKGITKLNYRNVCREGKGCPIGMKCNKDNQDIFTLQTTKVDGDLLLNGYIYIAAFMASPDNHYA